MENITSDVGEPDRETINDVGRCMFAANDAEDEGVWSEVASEYRRMARRFLRRLEAAGYRLEKTE